MEIIISIGFFLVAWFVLFLITSVFVFSDSEITKERKIEVFIVSFIEAIIFFVLIDYI